MDHRQVSPILLQQIKSNCEIKLLAEIIKQILRNNHISLHVGQNIVQIKTWFQIRGTDPDGSSSGFTNPATNSAEL